MSHRHEPTIITHDDIAVERLSKLAMALGPEFALSAPPTAPVKVVDICSAPASRGTKGEYCVDSVVID